MKAKNGVGGWIKPLKMSSSWCPYLPGNCKPGYKQIDKHTISFIPGVKEIESHCIGCGNIFLKA